VGEKVSVVGIIVQARANSIEFVRTLKVSTIIGTTVTPVDAGKVYHTGLFDKGDVKQIIKFNAPVLAEKVKIMP